MLNAGIVEVYQDSSNLQTCTRYTTCSDVLSGERLGFFDGVGSAGTPATTTEHFAGEVRVEELCNWIRTVQEWK